MSERPEPFLKRIFQPDVKPVISEGWIYGVEETEIYGGFDDHQAVDFNVPMNTPVLAAADGLAVASFYEVPIDYPPGNGPRTWKGRPVFWGYGLYVQILHPNGWVTVYGHLQTVDAKLKSAGAYFEPVVESPDALVPPILHMRAEDFGAKYPAAQVKAGDVIGLSGVTGMGYGQRTYDNWLAGKPYEVMDEEHVHFEVSQVPGPKRSATLRIDPFNLYSLEDKYPSSGQDWSALPGSLWLKED